jgi:hypothetical protein
MYSYFLNDFVWLLMGCGVALSRLQILDARKERIARTRDLSGTVQPVNTVPC